jgi:uncharacterized protein YdeI (YjbR/CyaY-like superfamily)
VKPTFFKTAEDFRLWLMEHHADVPELLVGFHKVDSGSPSITWPQSVDEALCFGWIDGRRKRIDAERYSIRFTPRKARSIWSRVNIQRVAELDDSGRMQAAGRKAFESRRENASGVYSYEKRPEVLPAPYAAMLSQSKAAQRFFAAQIPSYRRAAIWWVISAKQEATRLKRAQTLVELSKSGELIPQFTRR